jgi:Polyketide cyclase / dehydrase and lipid transport
MKRMIVVLWVVGALVVVIGAVALIGALLPVKHVATVRAAYGQTPEALWSAISDIKAYTSWREDLKSIEMVNEHPEHPVWKETGDFGTLTMERDEALPPQRLVGHIVGKEAGFGGRWIYEIAPSGQGATLTVTEEGEVYNPFFRFMSKFIFGHTSTMKAYLKQLGKKYGETVEPEVLRNE